VWSAVTASSPEPLMNIVRSGTPTIPTMGPALARHIRELPSARNGLSMAEELTLQILFEKGGMTAGRLFGWYNTRYEPRPFMGDSGHWRLVERLYKAEEPALRITGRRAESKEMDHHSKVELLPFGERLLRNEADWLASRPPERWVGGVRIDARQNLNWRFDDDREAVYER